MSVAVQYLQAVQSLYAKTARKSIEQIVLEYGKPFAPPARPRPKGIRKGRNKLCFMNSYNVAFQNGWTYVEGFAVPDCLPIPVHHAWVVDGNGVVVETTWNSPAVEYYGVPFDFEILHQIMFETRHYGALDPTSPAFCKTFNLRLAPV